MILKFLITVETVLVFVTLSIFWRSLSFEKILKMATGRKIGFSKLYRQEHYLWAFRLCRFLCRAFKVSSPCLRSSLTLFWLSASPVIFKLGAKLSINGEFQSHAWLEMKSGEVYSTDANWESTETLLQVGKQC